MPEGIRGIRLLMTADTMGGVWDYSLELARQLARRDIRTLLATMGRRPSAVQRRAANAVPGLIVQESAFRLEWMPEADQDELSRAGEWLLSLEARFRPDLVHLNGYVHAALPWRTPCLVVAHSCVLSWWQAVKGEAAPPDWDEYAKRVKQGMSRADAVVAPTHAILRQLTDLYGPLPQPQAIWNGRDAAGFRPGDKGSYIFSAGRLWDEAKNLAALEAVGSDIDWPVIAAGEWRRPDGSGQRLSNVECIGMLSQAEMAGWLSRAPIYALPAKYEPFGLTVLEAGLSGCALVLGDIPTLRELWDGVALFVPPDDHLRLRATLAALISDAGLRRALGKAARERALTFTGERMAGGYCQLYADLQRRRAPLLTSGRKERPASLAAKI